MKWTEEKIETFWALKDQGLNLKEIAAELGCSYSSAQNKSHELMKGRNKKMTDTPTVTPVAPTAAVTEVTDTPTDAPTTRAEILDAAKKIVTGDREKQYGSPEDNFADIAEFWTTYTGYPISAEDVAIMMALLKIARIRSGNYKADSFVDLCGYASIAAEIAGR